MCVSFISVNVPPLDNMLSHQFTEPIEVSLFPPTLT